MVRPLAATRRRKMKPSHEGGGSSLLHLPTATAEQGRETMASQLGGVKGMGNDSMTSSSSAADQGKGVVFFLFVETRDCGPKI